MKDIEIDILLIEDNVHDAELTKRALMKDNVVRHITHLKNGEAALDFLFGEGQYTGRNTDNKPKVILLDLKMPKVSGLEVLEKIKSHELTKKIPVLVLTSSKEHPDVEKSYLLGANSYIIKPVDFDNFRKAVNELGIYWMHISQPLL
ncbi:MAG: two-component system response regulator [Mucilaginibacter sp.]|nr:two-component system response regulator [Mucilaginibacter sp.]